MVDDKDKREIGHWEVEEYTQRMTTKDWKQTLLDRKDTIIFHGRLRQLVAKKIGYGLVEITKRELNKD